MYPFCCCSVALRVRLQSKWWIWNRNLLARKPIISTNLKILVIVIVHKDPDINRARGCFCHGNGRVQVSIGLIHFGLQDGCHSMATVLGYSHLNSSADIPCRISLPALSNKPIQSNMPHTPVVGVMRQNNNRHSNNCSGFMFVVMPQNSRICTVSGKFMVCFAIGIMGKTNHMLLAKSAGVAEKN